MPEQPSDTPQRDIQQDRKGGTGFSPARCNISSHLFRDFRLSKKSQEKL